MVKRKNGGILNKQSEDECLCCGVKGRSVGVRLQVNSCRACVSFFRKSSNLGLQFRCRRGDYKCILKSGTKMCNFCRFERCTRAGMTLKTKIGERKANSSKEDVIIPMSAALNTCDNKFDHNHATDIENICGIQYPSSSSESSSNMSLSDDQILLKETQLFLKHKSILEDVETILSGSLIARNNIFDPIYNPTCLQRMAICLQQYFSKWGMKSREEMKINKPISYMDFIEFRMQTFRMQAEMLMSLPEFRGLCRSERTLLYRIFWPRFDAFINIELALQTFGYDDENCMFVVKNDEALEIGPDNKYPDELFTDDPFDRRKIMRSGFELFMTELYKPIKKLKLDQVELSYLVTQILWSHKSRDHLSENTLYMREKILKSASSELQNHYIYQKQIDNYSWRLVEITKILAIVTKSVAMLIDNFLMAKILNQCGPHKWCPNGTVLCPLA
uniref:Nuclear receptor domain-containing protein n=1 Tax=Rhabditophanes sp. KR3021 TaxID=114890 RepID=A0AC35U3Z2_9BILA